MNITEHPSKTSTKLLLIGDSSSGKTGALACLAARGYKVRLIDLDDGAEILRDYMTNPASPYLKFNPKSAENLDYITLIDPMQNYGGKLVPAKATAWQKTIELLLEWKYKDSGGNYIDLGKSQNWGEDHVIVIDSLTKLAENALNFHLMLNGALGPKARTQNEARRDIGAAQNLIRDLLTLLFGPSFKCNIIVNSHITMVSDIGGAPKVEEGQYAQTPTGYPSAIGRALSPHIPRWFNSMLVIRTIGAGSSAKHKIFTQSQNLGNQIISAKTSAPLRVKSEYDIEWGLADYLRDVQGVKV